MLRINENVIIHITILRQPLRGIFNALYNYFFTIPVVRDYPDDKLAF